MANLSLPSQSRSTCYLYTVTVKKTFLTFDNDLSCSLNHAEGGNGYTGVVGRLTDVGEFQDIAANWHLHLPRQLHLATYPLHIRHGSADRNTGQVDAASRHHLIIGWGYGETGRHSTYCRGKVKQCKRAWTKRRVYWTTGLTSCWTDLARAVQQCVTGA